MGSSVKSAMKNKWSTLCNSSSALANTLCNWALFAWEGEVFVTRISAFPCLINTGDECISENFCLVFQSYASNNRLQRINHLGNLTTMERWWVHVDVYVRLCVRLCVDHVHTLIPSKTCGSIFGPSRQWHALDQCLSVLNQSRRETRPFLENVTVFQNEFAKYSFGDYNILLKYNIPPE